MRQFLSLHILIQKSAVVGYDSAADGIQFSVQTSEISDFPDFFVSNIGAVGVNTLSPNPNYSFYDCQLAIQTNTLPSEYDWCIALDVENNTRAQEFRVKDQYSSESDRIGYSELSQFHRALLLFGIILMVMISIFLMMMEMVFQMAGFYVMAIIVRRY